MRECVRAMAAIFNTEGWGIMEMNITSWYLVHGKRR
jgi:hypothetical protein